MPSIINATTTNGLSTSADNSGSLQLATNNGTTAVTIDTSQNVGIGTSSPTSKLDVQGSVAANGDINLGINKSVRAYDGTIGSSNINAELTLASDPAMIFKVRQGGSSTLSERMRIDASGDVGIGTTTSSQIKTSILTNNNQNFLYIKGTNTSQTNGCFIIEANRNTTNNTFYAIQYYNTAAGTDRFRVADSGNVTNSNGSYGTISDAKNKENIVDATPKLEKLNQLQVRNFNFKNDDFKQIGFVAQEFEQVFPSMVEEHKDTDAEGNDLGTTTKTIKTTVLIPILVKALQELNAKVEAQAVRIAELEGAK